MILSDLKNHKNLWSIIFLLLFSLEFLQTSAQGNNESKIDTVYIGVTSYIYGPSTNLTEGGTAAGIALLLCENRFTVEIGFLYGFKDYLADGYLMHGCTVYPNHCPPLVERNAFAPILLHYSYKQSKKINCFITVGVLFGGRYYIASKTEHFTRETKSSSLIAGTGITYDVFKRLQLRLYPTLRYNGLFFPGVFLDLWVPLYKKL